MIDSHIHLHDKAFAADREELLDRLGNGGVEAVINVGTDVDDSRRALRLAESSSRVFAAVGIHPHLFNRREITSTDLESLNEILRADKVLAVGEIGLDFFSRQEPLDKERKRRQKEAFEAQIELAEKYSLPVIVHCRDAYEECWEVLSRHREVSFLIHCYMGAEEMTRRFLALDNVLFSFAGNITYGKIEKNLAACSARLIPPERLLIETDAPYLPPVPHRGKRNDFTLLRLTGDFLARLKGLSFAELDRLTTENTKRFFRLSLE